MKIIEDVAFDNLERAIVASDNDLLTIRRVNINITELNPSSSSAILGCDLRRNKLVDIDQLVILAYSILRKFGYGLRLGYSSTPSEANGLVRIKNSRIQGFGPANSDYSKFNRDGIALEGGELWLKDTVISDVSDACVDCKGSLKAKNCTFEKGYRDIRIWPWQTVILSNCKVGTVWFQDNTSKLILFNTPVPRIEVNSGPLPIPMVVSVDPLTDPWFVTVDLLSKLIDLQTKRVSFEQSQLDALKSITGGSI